MNSKSAEWINLKNLDKASLFKGEIGRIEGPVRFCTTADWIVWIWNSFSDWDRSRHYDEMKEQIKAERIVNGFDAEELIFEQ